MLKKNFCLIPLLVRIKLVLIGLIKPFRLIYLLTTFRLFVDLISGEKLHPSSDWSFDNRKNVLFKEERKYRFLRTIFLFSGLIIAYLSYRIFFWEIILGNSFTVPIIIFFLAFWVNGMPELIHHLNLNIPFLTNKIIRKEFNPAEGKYTELQFDTNKNFEIIKEQKFSKFNFYIRENTNMEDPVYIRRGDVEMVERTTDGYWLGPKFQSIVISYTVILQLGSKSKLDVAIVDTMLGAREVLSLFEETIGKMSSNEDWWKD